MPWPIMGPKRTQGPDSHAEEKPAPFKIGALDLPMVSCPIKLSPMKCQLSELGEETEDEMNEMSETKMARSYKI